MAKIVNLNTARKARTKTAAQQQADANAAKHGRTKALKALEQARKAHEAAKLDGHRRDGPD